MKDIIKEVNVNVRDDCLVWLENTADGEYAKNVDINVGAGCYVTVYINGRKYKPFATGSHEIEWRAYEKNSGKITLVGANLNGRFRVPFGLGGIEFTAADGDKTRIGVNGELVVKLRYDRSSDARYAYGDKVYTAFGCSAKVTAADIRQKWIKTIREAVRDAIVGKLNKYKTADELRAAFDIALKPAIEKAVRKVGESMYADGIEVDECHISDLFAGGAAENGASVAADKDEAPAPEAEETAEEAPVTEEPEICPGATEEPGPVVVETPEDAEEPDEEEVEEESEEEQAEEEETAPEEKPDVQPKADDGMIECPGCHRPVAADGRFCKYCGYRLNI